jgi:hypothetical protein
MLHKDICMAALFLIKICNVIRICSCMSGTAGCAVKFISSNCSDAANSYPGITCSLPSSCYCGKFKKIFTCCNNVQVIALFFTIFSSL